MSVLPLTIGGSVRAVIVALAGATSAKKQGSGDKRAHEVGQPLCPYRLGKQRATVVFSPLNREGWSNGTARENAESAKHKQDVRLRASSATIELTAIAPDILRVGLFPDGRRPDYRSGAVVLQAAGGAVDPLRFQTFELAARPAGEEPGRARSCVSARPSSTASASSAAASARRGSRKPPRSSGTSTRPRHPASFNNLYTSIPFTLALHEGRATGFFLDNPGRVEFDLGKADPSGSRPRETGHGSGVFYLFDGPTPREERARAVHAPDRPDLDAAAVGARQPACRVGLHGRRRGAGDHRHSRDRGIP